MSALCLTRRWLIGGAAALAMAALGAGTAAAAESRDGAAHFIDGLAREAVDLASDRSLHPDDRAVRLRHLLDRGFDGEAISRFVLGRYWQTASATERAEFVALFRDFTALSYARRFDAYQGESLTVVGSSAPAEGKAVVHTRLVRADGSSVKVDWRVGRAADGWRVYDVVVEGISMVLTQRSEFASIIQRSGGSLDGLLRQLRDRTASFTAS